MSTFFTQLNLTAALIFIGFVLVTLMITRWAAKRTRTTRDFYSAGGQITGFQNGLAIAGDYMSAASFLGISGMVFLSGFDGLLYSIGFLVGWPIILLLIAEPLRNLGRYNFSDVVSFRFQQKPIRVLAACGSLATVLLYLIAQMVGAGKLIEVLFHLPYTSAIAIVGVLMISYVMFGGMLATTWVQIIKAVLLLAGATIIALSVLASFNFDMTALFAQATATHPKGSTIMEPGGMVKDPISAVSLGLALMFGTAGLPHILMRFFTVKDAKQANRSVLYATGFIGYFYILTFIIGFGAIIFLTGSPAYTDEKGALLGGSNMAAIQLAHALGGDVLMGFISAVAFATILAVVSGLTLAGASAISHDLYARVFRHGQASEAEEIRVSKGATVLLGILAMLLGIAFEHQNVAFMVGLAFAIAASANFPVLLLSMYWKKMTTRGAVIGGTLGLLSTIILMVLSKTIWVNVLGFDQALFPYEYPALFSMPLAFFGIWFFSRTDNSASAKQEREAFDAQYIRAQTGLGAEKPVSH